MDWFLYDNGFLHERVKWDLETILNLSFNVQIHGYDGRFNMLNHLAVKAYSYKKFGGKMFK